MNYTSINQVRLLRFAYTYVLASIIWWNFDDEIPITWTLVTAFLFALIITYFYEDSGGYQSDLYVRKDAIDDLLADLEFCGFKRLRSKKRIYLFRKGELAIISDEDWHYKVQLPSRFELVGEAYRKF